MFSLKFMISGLAYTYPHPLHFFLIKNSCNFFFFLNHVELSILGQTCLHKWFHLEWIHVRLFTCLCSLERDFLMCLSVLLSACAHPNLVVWYTPPAELAWVFLSLFSGLGRHHFDAFDVSGIKEGRLAPLYILQKALFAPTVLQKPNSNHRSPILTPGLGLPPPFNSRPQFGVPRWFSIPIWGFKDIYLVFKPGSTFLLSLYTVSITVMNLE